MTSGGSYYLTNDIDLGGQTFTNYIFSEFSGKLDGNGYTVYNFTITGDAAQPSDVAIILRANQAGNLEITDINFGTADNHIKLVNMVSTAKSFGVLIGANYNANYCTLRNINIYADADAPLDSSAKTNFGGFIGYARLATLENCKMYGSLTCGKNAKELATDYRNVGGFIGAIKGQVELINCENHADITVYPSTKEARGGGIAAYADTYAPIITGCKNYGNITCLDYEDYTKFGWFSSDSRTAGIIGQINYVGSTISECENHGKLFGTNSVASILAYTYSTTGRDIADHAITNCVNTGTYTGNATNVGEIYGLIDPNTTVTATGCTNSGVTEDFVPQVMDTTTKPSNDTTSPDENTTEEVTTTEKTPESVNTPAETTAKAPDTTVPSTTEPPKSSGCGGFTSVASLLALVVAAFGAAVVIKKN